MMAVCGCFDRGGLGQELFEDIDQLFEPGIAGEKCFDLGMKVRTFLAGLLVRKCVVVVLHDVFGILLRDHNIRELRIPCGHK
jgi:hypothetical protein